MRKRLAPFTEFVAYKILPLFGLFFVILFVTKPARDVSMSSPCEDAQQSNLPCGPAEQAPGQTRHIRMRDSVVMPTKHTEHIEKFNTVNKYNNKIILFTSYRTGSSFTGELFRQNPSVFYLFEPLKLVSLQSRNDALQSNLVEYLEDNFNCKFSKFLRTSKELYPDPADDSLRQVWYTKIFEQPQKRHGPLSVRDYEERCKEYDIHAIKIIRANKIDTVFPLMEKGVKVIHLIRDPRGAATSRFEIEALKNKISLDEYWRTYEKEVLRSVQLECRRYSQIYDLVTGKSSHHPHQKGLLQMSYRLIRYEDIAYNPKYIAGKIYKYLRLSMPTEVKQWLHKATSSDVKGGETLQRAYSTSRNSKSTAEAWRSKLPLALNLKMQMICGDVLQKYGYKLVDSLSRYRDTRLSLVNSTVSNIELLIR